MAQIKINNIVYGTTDATEVIYNGVSVADKLDEMIILDVEDNTNIDNESNNYLTYGYIVDSLTSEATNKVLSAKQGKVLNEKINNINNSINTDLSNINTNISNNRSLIDNNTNSINSIRNNISNNYYTKSQCDLGYLGCNGARTFTKPNSPGATTTINFSYVNTSESINILLMGRYGISVITVYIGGASVSVTSSNIHGSLIQSVSNDGLAITINHGNWCSIFGIIAAPYCFNSLGMTFTISYT